MRSSFESDNRDMVNGSKLQRQTGRQRQRDRDRETEIERVVVYSRVCGTVVLL